MHPDDLPQSVDETDRLEPSPPFVPGHEGVDGVSPSIGVADADFVVPVPRGYSLLDTAR